MRFSYLRAVLISYVLLDNADLASGIGQTKTVALGAAHEVDEPKHRLRPYAADVDREERQPFASLIEPLLPSSVSGYTRVNEVVETSYPSVEEVAKRWWNAIGDNLFLETLSKTPDFSTRLRKISEHRDEELTGMFKKLGGLVFSAGMSTEQKAEALKTLVKEYGSSWEQVAIFQMARKLPAINEEVIEAVEHQFFMNLETIGGVTHLYEKEPKYWSKKGKDLRASYLKEHKEEYDTWKEVMKELKNNN
ncbi:unnamed protein product [Hyaloperonospora brassicae]|uniref:RxLR effector candidate protein n=1 Tax=Hyaloperonospora brassicae TaxID=162125 RepID=A0AAV0U810_HYABA|nr:unnamed protein product [Hyaloperonospora brassicae]